MTTTNEYIAASEATRIEVHHEGGGAWAIHATNGAGRYTEANWNRDGHPDATMTRERAVERAGEFAAAVGLPAGLPVEVVEFDPPRPIALRQLLVDAAAALETVVPWCDAKSLAGRLRDAAADDVVHAAPEMLSVLKSLRRSLERLEDWRSIDATEIDSIIASDGLRAIDCVLAKAEPPQTTRHRVTVTVEVEVEIDTTPGEAPEPGNVIMAAVEAVRDGEGTVVAHEIVK